MGLDLGIHSFLYVWGDRTGIRAEKEETAIVIYLNGGDLDFLHHIVSFETKECYL
jgi:hypothetical protein